MVETSGNLVSDDDFSDVAAAESDVWESSLELPVGSASSSNAPSRDLEASSSVSFSSA